MTAHPARGDRGLADRPTLAAATVLLAIAELHRRWAKGGSGSLAAVIPTVDGTPQLRPSPGATRLVATAVAASAMLYLGASRGWRPRWLHRSGAAVAGSTLLARAIGDGRTVGFTKRVRGTAFATNDDRYFSPLCVLLGLAGWRAALRSRRADG